jgi:ABC-type phosphate transport system permease subunit
LVPWFEQNLDMSTGESLLAAGLILAVMILPFVATTSAEAFRSVRADLKEAALALGVNRWSLVRQIVIRYAGAGMFAAMALGLARAGSCAFGRTGFFSCVFGFLGYSARCCRLVL